MQQQRGSLSMEATCKRDGSNNVSTETEVDNQPTCCCEYYSQGETNADQANMLI